MRDAHCVDFIPRSLGELHRALADGVDIRCYLRCSSVDNFEWTEGCKERLGLIHLDYASKKRALNDSA